MNNLIIIGNGFDLAHDLKTSYRDFLSSLNNKVYNTPDQFSDILKEEYISILRSKQRLRKVQNIFKNDFIQQLMDLSYLNNWSDIEYHYFVLINDAARLAKTPLEHTIRINKINMEFEQIKHYLKIHLREEQKRFKRMDVFNNFFSDLNTYESLVLNFNYTNTVRNYLDSYKNIKLINIHGELDNDDNPMIFGFAATDAESKVLIDKNEEGYLKNIKKINYMFTNNDKELKSLMDETLGFDVVILGHSCGVSDRLILSQIFNHKNGKSITPFYFKDREGYLQTVINIDRITDDYSKESKELKSFYKLQTYPQCIPMIQHNSSSEEVTKFKNYLSMHEIFKISRYDPHGYSTIFH